MGKKNDLVRMTIRFPRELHVALSERRDVTGKSVNDQMIEAVATFLGMPVPSIPKGVPGPKPRKPQRKKEPHE